MLSFCGFSQTVHVKGKIIDKEKKAYPDLRVILTSVNDTIISYTNKKGEFEFNSTPGNHSLIIEVGAKNDVRTVAFPNMEEFTLQPIQVNETYIEQIVINHGETGELDPLLRPKSFTSLSPNSVELFLTFST